MIAPPAICSGVIASPGIARGENRRALTRECAAHARKKSPSSVASAAALIANALAA